MSKGDKKDPEKGKHKAPVMETEVNNGQTSAEMIEYDDQASEEAVEYDDQASEEPIGYDDEASEEPIGYDDLTPEEMAEYDDQASEEPVEYDDQASTGGEEVDYKVPTEEMIEAELEKERHRHNYIKALRSAVYVLIIVAAATSIVVVLLLPVLQITGNSMAETLQDGDIVLAAKSTSYQPGDVVAFYYNNNILVKRVIATAGDWVDIDADGNVSINGEVIDEPYIKEKALGYCNVDFPYQVPDGRSFLMGDNRETSMDSRNTEIGCVDDSMVLGKIKFCIWPFSDFGIIK